MFVIIDLQNTFEYEYWRREALKDSSYGASIAISCNKYDVQ